MQCLSFAYLKSLALAVPKAGTAQNENAPDSVESWDARRTAPPPKVCPSLPYQVRPCMRMARMGYSWNPGLARWPIAGTAQANLSTVLSIHFPNSGGRKETLWQKMSKRSVHTSHASVLLPLMRSIAASYVRRLARMKWRSPVTVAIQLVPSS